MSGEDADWPDRPWARRWPGGGPQYGVAYGRMVDRLREFLDRVAAAQPDEETLAQLGAELAYWSDKLKPLEVPEGERVFGRRIELPGRGQTMVPQLFVTASDDQEVAGTVSFGDYFLGGNTAAHGGAVPLLFDEVLGRLAQAGGRTPCRTAYLKTDYRSITPIGPVLHVRAWFEREEGRKRFLRATLHHGETLCAEADALFVELKPGQP